MAAEYNYTWSQGEDLTIELVYKTGAPDAATPVDLSGYAFRMDLVGPDGKVLSVFNDEAVTTDDGVDNQFEVTMGIDGSIVVELSRSLTLPGGALYKYISANPPQRVFSYDMFVRSGGLWENGGNRQTKILSGTMTVEESVTHWT
jgi:hypothetical protein